jgi:hypothetical protein
MSHDVMNVARNQFTADQDMIARAVLAARKQAVPATWQPSVFELTCIVVGIIGLILVAFGGL